MYGDPMGGHEGSFLSGLGSVWGLLGVVYMTFGKHMGTLEGRLYDV